MIENWNLTLYFLIFLAGLVDSIAGGGGLISLMSYSLYGLPPVNALANNKFSSTFGTAFATANYARKGYINYQVALLGAICAVFGSSIGAGLALRYSSMYFRYAMLVIVPVVTLLTLFNRSREDVDRDLGTRHYLLIAMASFLIGMYDGFFGPGTGMFLTLAFSYVGLRMIKSVGCCKVVNLTSNVVSLTIFMLNGSVDYSLGIPCAVASILGGIAGSELAIRFDNKVIRPMLLLVLMLLYLKLLGIF